MADFVITLISAASGLIGGLGGVFLGGWLGDRREREKRRTDFITRQLSELYGPLVSLRAGIRTRSELRVKIQDAAERIWKEKARPDYSLAETHQFANERRAEFKAIIEDDSTTFKTVLLPDYQQMLTTFREKMWLAEPETRAYFPNLVEFIDVWERYMRGTLPGEVVQEIEHGEQWLHPFYKHLEETHDLLRRKLNRETAA
jgi:uncharacterized protein Usg